MQVFRLLKKAEEGEGVGPQRVFETEVPVLKGAEMSVETVMAKSRLNVTSGRVLSKVTIHPFILTGTQWHALTQQRLKHSQQIWKLSHLEVDK